MITQLQIGHVLPYCCFAVALLQFVGVITLCRDSNILVASIDRFLEKALKSCEKKTKFGNCAHQQLIAVLIFLFFWVVLAETWRQLTLPSDESNIAGKRCAITRTIQIVLHVEFGHIHVNAMRMRWKRQKTNKHNNYLFVVRDVLNVSAQYVHQMERCFMRWSLEFACDVWQFTVLYFIWSDVFIDKTMALVYCNEEMLFEAAHHTFHFNLNPVLSRSGNTLSNVSAIDAGIRL